MPNLPFVININSRNDLYVSGKLDIENVAEASVLGLEIINTMSFVRVDLSGVQYADSSSLAMLVDWIRNAKMQHKDIILVNMPRFMLDLVSVCCLDTILPIETPLKFSN